MIERIDWQQVKQQIQARAIQHNPRSAFLARLSPHVRVLDYRQRVLPL